MKLIANCQLHGEYGMVTEGDTFDVRDDVGEMLIKNGNARKADPPQVVYETQALQPQETPEVRPETPFRDVHVPDTESTPVVEERNQELPRADVSSQPTRTADRSGRRRRP